MVESEWSIIIFPKYFKIQFAWPTFQKRSWTVMTIMSTNQKNTNVWGIIHSVHKHWGNTFQRQNYKMRLKQRSLNWINSMQVKKILFTNVFFSWSLCFKSQNVPTGVSDCHNIISTVIRGEVLHEPKRRRYYRSYKTFDIEKFLSLRCTLYPSTLNRLSLK
jgi:hypothetical protein